MFWTDKWNLLADQINKIFDALLNLQQTIGLKDDSDKDNIFSRIKNLEDATYSSGTPAESTIAKLIVERDVPISDDKFELKYTPVGGICMNDEVQIDNGDGTWDIWDHVSFEDNEGTLVDANGIYDGKTLKITYQYAAYTVLESLTFDSSDNELVKDFTDYQGKLYQCNITVDPTTDDDVTLTWKQKSTGDETTDTISEKETIVLYEDDLIYELYITGSANIDILYKYKIK